MQIGETGLKDNNKLTIEQRMEERLKRMIRTLLEDQEKRRQLDRQAEEKKRASEHQQKRKIDGEIEKLYISCNHLNENCQT